VVGPLVVSAKPIEVILPDTVSSGPSSVISVSWPTSRSRSWSTVTVVDSS
jgi:hypothetical protein